MPEIHILDTRTIDKIAAGEVIERPASAVKELVENSLDAGAIEITIKIESAGRKLIQIIDNGKGMSPEDAVLAFQRHATSKLSSIEDLDNIQTMGFRGEALSSISSVADITLSTRTKGSDAGIQLIFQNGVLKSSKDIGMDPGTNIEIRDLFANIPARLKFLKSDRVEMSHIINMVVERALANHGVSFTLLNGEVEVINCRGCKELKDRFLDIFGRKAARASVRIGSDESFASIHGILAKPEITKPSKEDLHIFVNGRPIANRVMASAINDGYAGMLMKNRHPVGVIFIQLSPERVDVNVHPAKREIKFSDPGPIARLVKSAVADALGNTDLLREAPAPIQRSLSGTQAQYQPPSHAIPTVPSPSHHSAPSQTHLFEDGPIGDAGLEEVPETAEVPGGKHLPAINPIGQINKTFIMAQSGNDLIIIDQHAAHERVMLDRLKKSVGKKAATQKLITPLTLELTNREKELVDHYRPILEDAGFIIEPFGRTTYLVRAIPVFGGHLEDAESILAMVSELSDLGKAKSIEAKRDDILHLIACHSSIRAGEKLSPGQMRRLISEMHELDNPYTCAHGRPTIIKMTERELEKMFKRVV
ncbi:MAG: DNA mismatch repair endonuclease MutL [Thermoplasmata archaeon]|nr:DNA mismatch repair endonuclease MutL [Thermoplasmata archaeon]